MHARTVDTLVVGAGPSGTACAITLQKSGCECVLVEKRAVPRFKLCGGLFTYKAQKVLCSILGEEAYTRCMAEVTCSEESILGLWRRNELIARVVPMRKLVLIDRPKLDFFLVRHYQEMGGQLIDGDALESVDFGRRVATLVSGLQIHYQRLVGADGTNSCVERLLAEYDPQFRRKGSKVVSLEINVDREDLPVEGVNIYFDIVPRTYAWAFNKGDRTCLGISKLPDQKIDINDTFRQFLAMLNLRHPERYPLRGAMIPFGIADAEYSTAGVMFVGDAAGLVEPLTWEGIYFALRSGQLAGESIANGDSYAKKIKQMSRKIRHGFFYQRLFEHPAFLDQFYRHGSKHTRFMAEYYSENIDDVPRQPLLRKVAVLFYKILKHKLLR